MNYLFKCLNQLLQWNFHVTGQDRQTHTRTQPFMVKDLVFINILTCANTESVPIV